MKKIQRLPSLSRVSPGNTATLELPIGPTYERLIFIVTAGAGLDAGDIGRIKLLANGAEIQSYKNLQRLNDLNAYWNREADTMTATRAEFALHLNRGELVDNLWRNAPGIGTADLSTLHLEIDIDGAAPADIKIVAFAQVDPVRQNIGAFFRVREYPASSGVAGLFEADKLPRGPWYSAIHLFKSDITDIEVMAGDVKVIDGTKAVLERFQKAASPKARVPQTGKATHIDFITDGNLLESLPTANLTDFRVKMTLGTAGAVDIVTETLDTITQ